MLDVVQAGKHTAAPDHKRNNDMDKYNHLTTDSTVADVINNPAFKGFGQYILPLEWHYDPTMKLKNIPSLLPYHNYVDASRSELHPKSQTNNFRGAVNGIVVPSDELIG